MTSPLVVQRGFLAAGIPQALVDELFEAFSEAKRRFYLDDLRPNAIEGGRFSEAAFRILQWATDGGQYTPLGKTMPSVDKLLIGLENAAGHHDSLRIHIPRTLRLIYDIRNKRDAAHLADGIDPNIQDASLVVRNMEWVLAELVRLYHSVSPEVAHSIIADLISREVPIMQMFGDFPRLLKDLRASDHVLVLLYWRGSQGALRDELASWVRPQMRANLQRTVSRLEEKHFVHLDGDRVHITHAGEAYVAAQKLVKPL